MTLRRIVLAAAAAVTTLVSVGCGPTKCAGNYPEICNSAVCDEVRKCCDDKEGTDAQVKNICTNANTEIGKIDLPIAEQTAIDVVCTTTKTSLSGKCN